MDIRCVRESERIDRHCRVFGHAECPQNERSIYENRPICNVQSRANSGCGSIKRHVVRAQIITNIILPATEAERTETQVVPQLSFCSKPPPGVEFV